MAEKDADGAVDTRRLSLDTDDGAADDEHLLGLDYDGSSTTRSWSCMNIVNLAAGRSRHRLVRLCKVILFIALAVASAAVYESALAPGIDPYDERFARFWRRFGAATTGDADGAGVGVGAGVAAADLDMDTLYPTDVFGSVQPVPCHSHNDYWRRAPLFAALGSGCVSVEADVWLHDDGELYVGHTRRSLRPGATLRRMYLEPLAAILAGMNGAEGRPGGLGASAAPGDGSAADTHAAGVFYSEPAQPLVLLVDFKTPSAATWPVLQQQLQPLRDAGWLTYWDGVAGARVQRPLIVVASGDVAFADVVANATYRDVFYDAPIEALADPGDDYDGYDGDRAYDNDNADADADADTFAFDVERAHPADAAADADAVRRFRYNPSNAHFASAKLSRAVGPLLFARLSAAQRATLRRQVVEARERRLVPRYWGTPRWPRGLRDAVWATLVQEDVGLLNVDDLRAMRRDVWGLWP